jgi:arylsulfatase A-like enzyme
VVLTTFGFGNYSVTGRQWPSIRYADDSEELYDRAADPHELSNLAADPKHAAHNAEIAKHPPKVSVAPDAKKKKKKSNSNNN